MKTFKFFTLFILMSSIMVSCSNLLDENPESYISYNNFFKTKEDADAAVLSIYAPLTRNHSRVMYVLNAYTTDEGGVAPGTADALNDYTFDPTQGFITEFWEHHYKVVNRANMAIEGMENMDIDEVSKRNLVAEARFLRAIAYFRMVRFYGGVPLVLTSTNSVENVHVPRNTVEEVYAQILDDLNYAEANLPQPAQAVEGRPSVAAAQGLLTKVYLTSRDWAKAKESAERFFQQHNSYFGLMDEFSTIFTPETQPNRENIWVLNFKANMPGDQQFELKYYLPRDLPGARGLSRYLPSPQIYDSFEPGDLRKDWTFFTSYTYEGQTYTFKPHWHKFMDYATLHNTDENDTDVPLIRYADVLLMYAEAENELNGPTAAAYDAINQVRRRAYGVDAPTPTVDLANLDQSAFRQAVWEERKWEFAGEWHRWFDLKRTGRLLAVVSEFLGRQVNERYALFPIPQREMDTNPALTQNPGY